MVDKSTSTIAVKCDVRGVGKRVAGLQLKKEKKGNLDLFIRNSSAYHMNEISQWLFIIVVIQKVRMS